MLYKSGYDNVRNISSEFIDIYQKPIWNLFHENRKLTICPFTECEIDISAHLSEFNISQMRSSELVQLVREKDFVFLKMKIENNGDRHGESPNPNPLYYLTKYVYYCICCFYDLCFRACFEHASSKYSEDVLVSIDMDSQNEQQDPISEQLMAINKFISVSTTFISSHSFIYS